MKADLKGHFFYMLEVSLVFAAASLLFGYRIYHEKQEAVAKADAALAALINAETQLNGQLHITHVACYDHGPTGLMTEQDKTACRSLRKNLEQVHLMFERALVKGALGMTSLELYPPEYFPRLYWLTSQVPKAEYEEKKLLARQQLFSFP